MEEENSLISKLVVLWNSRRLILLLTVISAVLSMGYAFYLPTLYKAECSFLPPNQDTNKLSVFVNNFSYSKERTERIGALADSVGFATSVTGGQMMLGLLKQNSVVDVIIDKFSLMERYNKTSRVNMRSYLVKTLLETNEDTKSGIVTVGVIDEDPKKAAEMANAFIETLQKKVADMVLADALQRRDFFERQLFKAWQALNDAQNDLLNYQEKIGGVATPRSQMEAVLSSITDLRRQIAEKNVEISAMRTYSKASNPRLRTATSQLEALTKELERLEEIQKSSNPHLSIEYQRYEMKVQYASKRYETILWQLEDAKLDEHQGFFQLQVVDWATPPDFKYKPSKARIIIIGTFLGALLGCTIAVFSKFFAGLKKVLRTNPEFKELKTESSSGKLLSLFSAILVMAAIILLTFQSSTASVAMSVKFQNIVKTFLGSRTPAWVLDMKLLRAFAHVFLYFPLSAALFYVFSRYGHSCGIAAFSAFLTASAFGLADEAVKMFLPSREFDFADWTLDIFGIVLGILFSLAIKFLFSIFRRRKLNAEV